MKCIQYIMTTSELSRLLALVTTARNPALQSLRSFSVWQSQDCGYRTGSVGHSQEQQKNGRPGELLTCARDVTGAVRVRVAGLWLGSVRGMAGHSKWSNIRHIKAAKDSEKARIASNIVRRMRALARETGQYDPKSSIGLTRLVAEAKSKNIPSSTIDNALAQLLKIKNAPPMLFEAKGPSGSVMLIEAATNKRVQMRGELQGIVKKCGFNVTEGAGTLAQMVFEEKGVVLVNVGEGVTPNMDTYVEMAIEAGAEDVTLEEEDGAHVLQFVCGPGDTMSVKKKLEEQALEVASAEVMFNANAMVALAPAVSDLVDKALFRLDQHPDVMNVYTNFGGDSS